MPESTTTVYVNETRTVTIEDECHAPQPLSVQIHIHGAPDHAIASITVRGPWQSFSVAMSVPEMAEVRDAINSALTVLERAA